MFGIYKDEHSYIRVTVALSRLYAVTLRMVYFI